MKQSRDDLRKVKVKDDSTPYGYYVGYFHEWISHLLAIVEDESGCCRTVYMHNVLFIDEEAEARHVKHKADMDELLRKDMEFNKLMKKDMEDGNGN